MIDYMGVNVSSDDPNWVYCSPMSWNHDSTRATWLEEERGTGSMRVQIATLKDAVPGYRPATVPTPEVGDYADTEILAQTDTYTLNGVHSGTVVISKKKAFFNQISEVKITYDNYSDDGGIFYNGTEYAKGSMITKTTYTSDVTAVDKDGNEVSMMDVEMVFSAAIGLHTLTDQIMSPLLKVDQCHGTSRWMDREADISTLIP